MPAQWVRVNPALLTALTPKPGGTMVMATAAKKHLTIFTRSRRAPGAGRPEVKEAFAEAAHKTRDIGERSERNKIIKEAIERKGLRSGKVYKKSKSKPGTDHHGMYYYRDPDTGKLVYIEPGERTY